MFVPSNLLSHSSSLILSQRGALACAEFTGNIVGYAFSVVSTFQFFRTRILTFDQQPFSGQTIFVLS